VPDFSGRQPRRTGTAAAGGSALAAGGSALAAAGPVTSTAGAGAWAGALPEVPRAQGRSATEDAVREQLRAMVLDEIDRALRQRGR
jgi:hypothetical protein